MYITVWKCLSSFLYDSLHFVGRAYFFLADFQSRCLNSSLAHALFSHSRPNCGARPLEYFVMFSGHTLVLGTCVAYDLSSVWWGLSHTFLDILDTISSCTGQLLRLGFLLRGAGFGITYFKCLVIYLFWWSDVLCCVHCLVCFYRSGVPDYNIHTYIHIFRPA